MRLKRTVRHVNEGFDELVRRNFMHTGEYLDPERSEIEELIEDCVGHVGVGCNYESLGSS